MNFLDEYKEAILEEYRYLSDSNPRIPLFDGRFEYEEKDGLVYYFTLNKELGIPDGTPVYVFNELNVIQGFVLYSETFELVLKVNRKLNLSIKVEFTSSVYELLRILLEKLQNIDYHNNLLVRLLIDGKSHLSDDTCFHRGQKTAISKSLKNPITVIWGPPGTGKTHTLAEIALSFFYQGKSVLIVSQSNIAVDNAMIKIKQFIRNQHDKTAEGRIFRAGYSKIKEVFSKNDENDFYINARQYVEKTNPELIHNLNLLLKSRTEEHSKNELKEIDDKIKTIRRFIHNAETELIFSAQILGTTISKATVDNIISQKKYDVVLFDEASMAYVPQIVYACSLAQCHFICIGDFRQLSPIVQCNEKNILNKDIFDFLGIYEAPKIRNHEWLVMLCKQRRMHPAISGFVKRNVYFNLLSDHSSVMTSVNEIVEKGPMKNESIGYYNIDMLSCSAQSKEVGKTYSHFNLISAFVDIMIALKAKNEGQKTIAILSPYKNQVNLIKSIFIDLGIGQENGFYCSTIHQFQGRESDVVVFDTVDAYPMKKVGKMFSQDDSSYRLINVAMTRAKGKFILVGSVVLAKGNKLLNSLWQYVIEKGSSFPVNNLLRHNVHPKLEILESKTIIITKIDKKFDSVLVSFNNDVLEKHKLYFDLLESIMFTSQDHVFMDKTVDENKLPYVASQINSIAKLGIVYKSNSYNAENILIFNGRYIILPFFFKNRGFYNYIGFAGKSTVNTLMDFEYASFIEESRLKGAFNVIKQVNSKVWVRCPICDLNMMHEGEDCCSVCAAKKKPEIKRFVEKENRVTLWDICQLWAALIGETHMKIFYNNKKSLLRNIIANNKNIARVYDTADWSKDKKIYYFDRNDVFREFFLVEKRVGPAIQRCAITSYTQLLNNILYVSRFIK